MKSKFDILIEKRAYLPYILVFLIVFIPQGICVLKAIPYAVYDEIGPLKFLGYITGERNLGELETAYYGWGTYIWMFPTYFITKNPIYRYRALCVYSVFLHTLSAVLTFIICHRYLMKKRHIIYSVALSVMVGYIASHDIVVHNEHGLLVISCLVLLFICKAFSSEDSREKNIFLAFLAAFYGLTMHTRAVILIMALVCSVLIYWLFFKVKLLKKKQIIALLVIGVCVRKLIKIVEKIVWARYSSTGSVKNTSIGLSMDKINCFFSFDFWKTMWIYCFGQMYALNIVMGGAVILIFFSFTAYIINSKFSISELELQRNFFIILVFGMCTAAMLVGVGINWGVPIYKDGLDIYGTNSITLKGINYTRYSLNYIVPLCVLSLSISLDNSIYKRKYEIWSILGQVVCFLYWYDSIYPKVKNSVYSIEYFTGIMYRRPNTGIPYERLLVVIFITLNIIMLIGFINKKILYFLFLDVFLIYSFMGSFYCDTYQYEIIRSEYQRASYRYLMERFTDEDFNSIDKIYAYNVDSNREQFYINKVRIVAGLPEDDEQNVVIMYYGDYSGDMEFMKEVSIDDYHVYMMAENCYLMVKGRYLNLFHE